jgi:hypothetical protein
MALAESKGVKPGSSIGSHKITIPDPVVTSTGASTKDFQFTQPAGTIIESIYVHAVEAITLSSGSATSDLTVSIGTATTYDGVQLAAATTLIDYSAATTEAAGTVTKITPEAAYSGTVAQNEVTFYGQVALGAAATVDTAGDIEVHIVYRHF